MPFSLKDLFAKGSAKLVESIGDAFDKNFTNKEEKAKALLDVEKEVNRHMETLQDQALKEFALEIQDKDSARKRETAFVQATGHMDYLQWFLAVAAVGIFTYFSYAVIHGLIHKEYENLVHNILGIIEGIFMSIYNYYFGSSAGSRVKDMKPPK